MTVGHDIAYAARALRKSRAVTALAILALALGIGANTAIFSTINAVLLDSAPLRALREAPRVVMVWERNPQMMAFLAERMPVALANFREWRRQSQTLSDWALFADSSVWLGGASRDEHYRSASAASVPADFFDNLGVRFRLGRPFTVEEARDTRDSVAIVSAAVYEARFGGDSNLAGKTVRINGADRVIVGVLPASFALPAMWEGFDQKKPEVWLPFDSDRGSSDDEIWARRFFVYARLRPGVSLDQARAEMTVIGTRLKAAYPKPNAGMGVNVTRLSEEDAGPEVRQGLLLLEAAVGFVLLIACANVANLLLARAVSREREIAVRLALGAPRWRIVRLALIESLMLSLAAGVLGVVFGFWAIDALSALAPDEVHGMHELRLDPRTLVFSLALAIFTGLLFGMAPALHSANRKLSEILRSGRGSSGGSAWMRSGLVVAEVAAASLLLVGAGLTIRSLVGVMRVDSGFGLDRLLTIQATLASPSDPKGPSKAKVRAFADRVLEVMAALPGVNSVSISTGLPMESVSERNYEAEGAAPLQTGSYRMAGYTTANETFFRTLDIPLKRGREFTRAETEMEIPSVVIVNEPFARATWPGEEALGKIVVIDKNRMRIVGVVGAVRQMGPETEPRGEMFLPGRTIDSLNIAVRTAGEPLKLGPAARKAIEAIDPNAVVSNVRDMRTVARNWVTGRRFLMTVFGAFAGLALVLAAIGLYGVLAYLISMRTREFGIRVALGANRPNLLGLVIGQGLRLTLTGLAIGLGLAFSAAKWVDAVLFGVTARDPWTYVAVATVMAAVALAATLIPARRAAGVNPLEALRSE